MCQINLSMKQGISFSLKLNTAMVCICSPVGKIKEKPSPQTLESWWNDFTMDGSSWRHVKDKKVVRSSQHGFIKATWLPSMVGQLIEGGRAMVVVCLDFSKAFGTVCNDILISKLRKCGLDQWTVKWLDKSLNGRAQRVMNSGTGSSWRSVTSRVLQRLKLSPI